MPDSPLDLTQLDSTQGTAPTSAVAPNGDAEAQYFLQHLPAIGGIGQPPQNPTIQQPDSDAQYFQQHAPTVFSSDTSRLGQPQFNTQGMNSNQLQQLLVSLMKDNKERTDPSSPGQQQLQQQLQRLQYTPDKRVKDMLDSYHGITHDAPTQLQGPNGPVTIPGQTHTNWLQAITSRIGEGALAIRQKENYVPLQERLMNEATKQYQAEAIPAARDLMYESQERRSAMTQMSSLMRTLQLSQNNDVNNSIKEENVKRQTVLANNTLALGSSRVQYLAQKAAEAAKNGDYITQRSMLAEAQTEMTKEEGKLYQQKIAAAQNDVKYKGLKGDALTSAVIQDMRNQGQYDEANGLEHEDIRLKQAGQSLQIIPGGIGGVPAVMGSKSGQTQYMQTPGQQGGAQQGNNTPGPVGTAQAPNTAGGMPVPSNPDWLMPKNTYGMPTVPLQRQFPGTPTGRDNTNDAAQVMPNIPLKPEDPQFASAKNLYTLGKDFNKTLDSLPDKVFGTFSGNAEKILAGKVDLAGLGITDTTTQAQIRKLQADSIALATAHLGSQRSRSFQGAEAISNELQGLGTSRQSMKAYASGIIGQSKAYLFNHPETKALMSPLINSYPELEDIYHPDQYAKDLKGESGRGPFHQYEEAKDPRGAVLKNLTPVVPNEDHVMKRLGLK